jgi:hypothetical protein
MPFTRADAEALGWAFKVGTADGLASDEDGVAVKNGGEQELQVMSGTPLFALLVNIAEREPGVTPLAQGYARRELNPDVDEAALPPISAELIHEVTGETSDAVAVS